MTSLLSNRGLRLCLAAALVLAGSACGGAATGVLTGAPTPGVESLATRIAADIGDAACDNSSQCRTLPYGHKACGGPERYLPYSTKVTDPIRLTQLAQQLAEARRREDQRDGMMSTCSVELDPGATCNAGRCVLQPQSPGAVPLAR